MYVINYRLHTSKYMDKVKTIVLELEELNNEEFVIVCSLFYKNLQFVDNKIINTILDHEGNKVIINKLYYLSKLNGNFYILIIH